MPPSKSRAWTSTSTLLNWIRTRLPVARSPRSQDSSRISTLRPAVARRWRLRRTPRPGGSRPRQGDEVHRRGKRSQQRIAIEGEGLDWPSDEISGAVVRKLGRIAADRSIYLERSEEPDRLVEDGDTIKIKKDGIEQFRSRKPEAWELNVQGKKVVSATPIISVVDALSRAGFDPNAWIIILKVAGQPKRQLSVGDEIDLRAPGIEKIRLTAKDVSNGEARAAPSRDFALLEVDETYLDGLGIQWETRNSDGHRWLIIRDYPVPDGYTAGDDYDGADDPADLPPAEIDMFYAYPPLQRKAGGAIPATEATQSIGGLPFQRWSRHRGSVVPWNPQCDNVVSHLALVESSLAKEVGE